MGQCSSSNPEIIGGRSARRRTQLAVTRSHRAINGNDRHLGENRGESCQSRCSCAVVSGYEDARLLLADADDADYPGLAEVRDG
jgi:hypothetical protein